MSDYKRLHIPHMINEFDENMLVPLSGNFSEIQRHVSLAQARLEALEAQMDIVSDALTTIDGTLESILAILSTST